MCPGCKEAHTFPCNGKSLPNGASWSFDLNMDRPTITPSINIAWGKQADPDFEEPDDDNSGYAWSGRCHSIVTAGKIFFAGDSTHALSGQIVDLPDIT